MKKGIKVLIGFVLAIALAGTLVCLGFRADRRLWELER